MHETQVPSIDLVDLPGLAFGNSHKASDKAPWTLRCQRDWGIPVGLSVERVLGFRV